MVLTLADITRNGGAIVITLCCRGLDSTVSIDSLYSNLKMVTRPVDMYKTQ